MRVYSGVRVVNFGTSKNLVVKSSLIAKFINTPGPVLRETHKTSLIMF
jgi:hypothetical protein